MSCVNSLVEIYCCESIARDLDKLLFAVECFEAVHTDCFQDSVKKNNDIKTGMDGEQFGVFKCVVKEIYFKLYKDKWRLSVTLRRKVLMTR